MKSIAKLIALCLFAGALASCGGGSSSSGCFGSIPSEIQKFENKEYKNFDAKKDAKEKAAAEIEKMAIELNGKPLNVEIGADLKMEQALSLEFQSMSNLSPTEKFVGELVADKDLSLKVDPSDLTPGILFSEDEMIITVKMPVAMDCLAKDGSVIKSYEDVGTLEAENLKTSAVVKAGTPVEFRTFNILKNLDGTETLRFYVNLDKTPYTNRSLVK